jgi:endo-beta-N-acetylglucosaminidase D
MKTLIKIQVKKILPYKNNQALKIQKAFRTNNSKTKSINLMKNLKNNKLKNRKKDKNNLPSLGCF